MDTRFWGPSGWKLLHTITFNYTYSQKDAIAYAQFFDVLPYILPCKFCRASLTDYYRQHPYKKEGSNAFNEGLDMRRWMYDIHNCVNAKLRKQGLNPNPDPKFSDVKELYEKMQQCDWHQQMTTFWDFLFAVAYNHPKETTTHSTPMPECPQEVYKCKDKCERNKWNILSLKERLYWYKRFWKSLPAVLPIKIWWKWEDAAAKNPMNLECRKSAVAWLWRMRCTMDSDFKDPYTSVCRRIATYSSDCGKKRDAYTCRKRRLNKTVKNKK